MIAEARAGGKGVSGGTGGIKREGPRNEKRSKKAIQEYLAAVWKSLEGADVPEVEVAV